MHRTSAIPVVTGNGDNGRHESGREVDQFREDVLTGLRSQPKRLPPKLFYDDRGSRLFDAICELDEYYPTRTEIGILQRHIDEICDAIGPEVLLVEFGSGSGLKTRILLDRLERPAGYVPIDIAETQLREAAAGLRERYPGLAVRPLCADYLGAWSLPEAAGARRTVAFFPGSTIGNLEPAEAEGFLQRMAATCGAGGGLVIGVDLKKDRLRLERAYNDAQGVTAAFNLNLLARINATLGADFSLDGFQHRALYDEAYGRIEMHLDSLQAATVRVAGETVTFRRGESIVTEYSYKYDLAEFVGMAGRAGWTSRRVWVDPDHLFSVHYLSVG